MQGNGDHVFNPLHYRRGYTREHVLAHVGEALSIYHELDAEHEIPAELATSVFAVVQTMVAAVEPVPGTPADPATKLAGGGLVAVEGAEAARLVRETAG